VSIFKLDLGFVESMRHFLCLPFSPVKKASRRAAPFSALAFCLGVFDRGERRQVDKERERKGGKKREEALAAAVHVMPPLSHIGDIPNMEEFSSIIWILLAVCYPCRSIVGGQQRSHKVLATQTEAIKGYREMVGPSSWLRAILFIFCWELVHASDNNTSPCSDTTDPQPIAINLSLDTVWEIFWSHYFSVD
jgi:hypothetical protein